MSFSTFQLPTRIIIGSGSIGCAPDELRAIEVTKPLLVTDPGIAHTEVFEDIRVVLDEAGIPFEVFKDVEAQPSARTVEDAFSLYERSECDGLLALGGGSSIDTAKGAAILATNGGKPQDYDGFDKYSVPPAPLVAIPTTAGTGSEVSYAASISDTDRGIKFTIRHSQLNRAKVAILDPDVLRTLPRHVATVTGMDALTHAVESYTSLEATPITEAASLYATELIGTHLRPFVANRGNGEAAKKVVAQLKHARSKQLGRNSLLRRRAGECALPGANLGGEVPHGTRYELRCNTAVRSEVQCYGQPFKVCKGGLRTRNPRRRPDAEGSG